MRLTYSFIGLIFILLLAGCTLSKPSPALQDPEKAYTYDATCNDPKSLEASDMVEFEPGIYPIDLYLAKCPAIGKDLLKNHDLRPTLHWYVMNMASRNRKLFGQLPDALKVNYLIWELEGEVNNGGYRQFFGNSSGAYKDEIVGALQKVGANKAASITQRAVTLNSKLTNSSSASLKEEIDNELYTLDGEFYDEGQSDIGDKADVYVRQNAGIIHEWMSLHAQEYLNTALPDTK